MEWAQAIGIASWCFVIGIFVGEAAVKRRSEKRKSAPEIIISEGIREVRLFEKFAGSAARSTCVFIDQKTGEYWRCIIEREQA